MVVSILLILVGFALLIEGASNVSKRFHIPEIIIGLTVVSMGTSMPELFVSITSAIEGHADMAIGNVVGSNACNMLLILGLSAVIRPIKFKRETRLIEIPICLAITVLFLGLCNMGNDVSKIEAGILITLFIAFIIYTIIMAKKGEKFDAKDNEESEENLVQGKTSMIKDIIYIILGIIGLKFGGDLTVDNAVNIANMFNISEKIISVTILAARNKSSRTCYKCYSSC